MSNLSRFLAIEAGVSALINGALSAGFTVILFSGKGEVPPFGADGFALDFPIQSFMVALMSVTAPSLIVQARLRSGKLAFLRAAPVSSLWRRALGAALAAAAVLGGAAMLASLAAPPLAFASLMAIKIAYGAGLGAVLTVWALRRIVAAA
jgi:hypothetical protein